MIYDDVVAIKSYCQDNKCTISIAESITSGNIQAMLVSISGISSVFLGGMTAYTIEQKCKHLGVDYANALRTNCVSQQTADEMAVGVCKMFGATIGLATTGYAEPYSQAGVEMPYAYISLYDARSSQFVYQGRYNPEMILPRISMQQEVAKFALQKMSIYFSSLL